MKKRSIRKRVKANLGKKCDDPAEPQAAGGTRQMVIDAAPKIIQALIDKAKEGSYLHARMLFEFAGLTGASEASEKESPLVAILMKELGLTIPPDPLPARHEAERPPRALPTPAVPPRSAH
jgi:hypothetical protein